MDTTALLLVDLQLDYFPGGAYPLSEPDSAARVASAVLAAHRVAGLPVVHVQHVSEDADSKFFRLGTAGAEIHPSVVPVLGEPVVTKAHPNSFRETTLQAVLDELEVRSLVVAGMMTSMCVDATVRAASDLGYSVTVIADGCAAPAVSFGGVDVSGPQVHAAFLAMLANSYARVVAGADVIAALGSLDPSTEQ